MGERLLCKQEVVGSIPSGSTSRVRRISEQRISLQKKPRLCARPEVDQFAPADLEVRGRMLSDIVKRRSIRAPIVTDSHGRCAYSRRVFAAVARRPRSCAHVGGADRAIVGPILCKLVFQSVSCGRVTATAHAECGWALIMRAIKCLKGIWWMPWR